MTNREALQAFLRNEKLDQPTIRRLLSASLIKASDVTNHHSPLGQNEYLPISVTLKGQLLLDKAQRGTKRQKRSGYKTLAKVFARFEVKAALGLTLAFLTVYATYKYTGAEELRTQVYSPLNSELSTIESSLNANSASQPIVRNQLNSLMQSGQFYRLPKSLQLEIANFYSDCGQLQSNVVRVTELLERELSRRIQLIKSEESDSKWISEASARIRS